MIDEILKYNKEFVEEKKYEQYKTSKYPDKKIAIITCMDTRLTELLPAALGIRNGDVKIIKNAGGVVSHAFGSVVRSVLVGIFELGIEEVMVIGHSDCGVQHINSDMMIKHMMDRGVDEEKIELIRHCGIAVSYTHLDVYKRQCKGCDKRSVRACCYVICSLYVFTGTGKTHSMV